MCAKHISFSEMKNWHHCPYYHKLVHIDKLKGFVGNEYTAFGKAVHSICEKMLLSEGTGNTEPWDPALSFKKEFLEELRKLPEGHEYNKKLIADMKVQGVDILPSVLPTLREYFGEYQVVAAEEPLYEPIHDAKVGVMHYKGFIDLVLKTSDGKLHVIDWKTCSWGWDARRRSDKMTTYQLTFYKYFYAQKYGVPVENVETHFGLLKRTVKSDKKAELFRVTSGKIKIKNALNFMNAALYNINNKNYVKNRLACHGKFGTCEFYKTTHCP